MRKHTVVPLIDDARDSIIDVPVADIVSDWISNCKLSADSEVLLLAFLCISSYSYSYRHRVTAKHAYKTH